MSAARIASRYAKTLMDISIEKGSIDRIVQDVNAVASVAKLKDVELLLKSPIIHSSKKLSIFKEIFNGKLDDISQKFFELIIKKGREAYIPVICTAFNEQYNSYKNISELTITSASTLEEAQLEAIKQELIKSGITRKNLSIIQKINTDLIGGFIIESGDLLIDNSVKGKLEKIRKQITK